MSAANALAQPPAPEGVATREAVEAVLREHKAALRFVEWNFTGADLSALDLAGCEFMRCAGARVTFTSAILSEARFDACDLNNSKWAGARLGAARFADCKLTGAQLRDVTGLDLSFTRCLMVSAYLRGLSFRHTTLEGLNLEGADLTACDFRETVFNECVLREATLTNARFDGADLRGADLGALRLQDASRFKGAVISKRQAADLLRELGLKVL